MSALLTLSARAARHLARALADRLDAAVCRWANDTDEGDRRDVRM